MGFKRALFEIVQLWEGNESNQASGRAAPESGGHQGSQDVAVEQRVSETWTIKHKYYWNIQLCPDKNRMFGLGASLFENGRLSSGFIISDYAAACYTTLG